MIAHRARDDVSSSFPSTSGVLLSKSGFWSRAAHETLTPSVPLGLRVVLPGLPQSAASVLPPTHQHRPPWCAS